MTLSKAKCRSIRDHYDAKFVAAQSFFTIQLRLSHERVAAEANVFNGNEQIERQNHAFLR